MSYENTMPKDGLLKQNADNNRRSMETAKVKLSETVFFRAATIRAIEDAHEQKGEPASLFLARQGLYDSNREDVVFHPENIGDIAKILQEGYESDIDTYKISRETYNKVMGVLGEKPELLYITKKSGGVNQLISS